MPSSVILKAEGSSKPLQSSLLPSIFFLLLASVASVAYGQAHPWQRIISIGGSLTEIIYALGAQESLVAVDATSYYPPEASQRFPNVGYMRTLSAEPILSLNPDLIIASSDAGPPQTLDQLRAAGTNVVVIPDFPSMQGLYDKIDIVAELLGRQVQGSALIAGIREQYAQAAILIDSIDSRPSALFLLSIGSGAPMAAGSATSADAMITMAGGRNALAAIQGFRPVSPEAIVATAPEYIIIPQRTLDTYGSVDKILQIPELAGTPAAQTKNLLVFDNLFLIGFGPRTVEAVLKLASQLHSGFSTTGLD
ncbi:MAG: hemin ABC transporter substrate-binding protein [Gammaproteobacteria bacterium]|nr:hemin ABC transporter substrate-binding protein [Gammaproteobacteria bacterium]